ncbi:MAG: DEAD/DEAH box helicase [Saprospiraceae bacterium]|nr:DEAD/DEAH box helicase [Saprospiraceae bacterium]
MAIFNALIENEESIILYIAPFKSLAFEVEQTLDRTFTNLGFQISHIYGGSQFTKIDEMLIQGSRILIVTPEKAKAIIRGNEELANKIKLVIIDEGHLLGNDDRLISIEMFYEELRHHIESNSAGF